MHRLSSFLIVCLLTWIAGRAQVCSNVDSCWEYSITGSSHTIILLASSSPLLNGAPLPAGSYIGVFYDAGSGALQCGGSQQWDNANTSLTAFGNDGTPKNGFNTGELFRFKYLLPNGKIIDSVTATFAAPPGSSGIITHTNSYATDGISLIDSMKGFGNESIAITLSGNIMTETGIPVTSVSISLTGTNTAGDTTSAAGNYELPAEQGGDYTITPSKSNDVNTINGISTNDILLLRRHILGIQPLASPYKIIAGDVNFSNGVSTGDIILMRSVILAITAAFPNGKLWTFVPHDYSFSNPQSPFPFPGSRTYSNITESLAGQDFIAMKLGDVNNSWNPNAAKAAASSVQLAMDEYAVMQGEEVLIPVKVKDFRNITGYQFTLSWNPEVLEFSDVKDQALETHYGTMRVADGFLTASWNDDLTRAITLNDGETVFELRFKVIGETGSFSPVVIGSELTASEAYNENLDVLNIEPANGMVKVGDISTDSGFQTATGWELSVTPNPFTGTTRIIIEIPEMETISISIIDLLGREVWHQRAEYGTGINSIEWAGVSGSGESLTAGLYLIRLTGGVHFASCKAILIR